MAVRNTETNTTDTRRAWLIAASLVVLFVAALFLRVYWNLDAAHPEEGTFLLSGGSDPYYHKHAVDAILDASDGEKFTTLVHDPMLNYPFGSVNPNPPLFQWTSAVVGFLLTPFFDAETAASGATLSAEQVATWWAFLWLPAIFGALTLVPLYFIGKTLFDWRVGLVAAALWAFSTSAIDGTGLGLADHDAMVLFFIVTAFLFYIKTIEQFRGDGNWVANWRDGSHVSRGLGRLFRERRGGFAYALLTGVSISSVALVWKGFPYAVGIIFVYAVLQFVIDHWRNRDSTGLWVATVIALLVGTLLAYPYYAATGLQDFITPVFYVIAALILVGVILVPTRDLPSLLVLPAAAIAGIVLMAAAVIVFPNVAQKLLSATIYFKQTTLYTTIAEAHPADFSTMAFGIGPVPFLLALAGWFVLLFRMGGSRPTTWIFSAVWLALALAAVPLAKVNAVVSAALFLGATFVWLASMAGTATGPVRAHLFALVWAGVAIYMAASAVRFLFNAIPAFALFGAFMIVWVIDWLDFGTVRRHMAGTGGWAGVRKGLRPIHVIVVSLIALFLVVPNAMLAADAALPRSSEIEMAQDAGEDSFAQNFLLKRFGAYGQSFLDPDWQSALAWLDAHDANETDPTERPAFLSWWDYGHWAISVGDHPAVADNFQNGYQFAANFLLAQNETHAIQLLGARLLPLVEQDRAEAILADAGADDAAAAREQLLAFEFVESISKAEAVDLVLALEQETGKSIRYFATDIRMMPLDDPNTPGLSTSAQSQWDEQTSIFYAPVTLAEREGDDYVAIKLNLGTNDWVTQDEFRERASNPVAQVVASAERLEYKEPFFNSMYYQGFVGTEVQVPPTGTVLGDEVFTALVCALPGEGLEHFRLVYANRGVKILEFTPGATVTGTVLEDGQPAANVTVTAYDDAAGLLTRPSACPAEQSATGDVPHGSAQTDSQGRFEVRAPFALGGDVKIVATRDRVVLGNATVPGITRDAAEGRASFEQDIVVEKGSVTASGFIDLNNDGQFQPANDTAAEAVNVTIGGVTGMTDSSGNVTLTGVPGGRHQVRVESERYELVNPNLAVQVAPGGEPAQVSIALREKSGTVQGRLVDQDGEPVEASTVIAFEPTGGEGTAQTFFTGDGGFFNATLRPGEYRLNLTGFTDVTPETVTVRAGATTDLVEFRATRSDEA